MRELIRKVYLRIYKYFFTIKNKIWLQWQGKKAKHISINVCDLFFQQNHNDGFERLDIIVRYLAIENYFGLNDFGFEMYNKMQEKRMGKEHAKISADIFRKLIKSWTENGYDPKYEIECDCQMHLLDGSHRLALALYSHLDVISCKVFDYSNKVFYGKKWFVENNFTLQEIKVILKKYEEISTSYNQTIACILWPPIRKYFDEITSKMRLLYTVNEYRDIEFSDETFKRAVKGVYHIDDIADWKIDKKIERMEQEENKEIRLLKLKIDVPDYRLKDINNNTISKVGEEIKGIFRECYKNSINDYFYDIIIHTGDNYQQSQYVYDLFEYPFNLSELFSAMNLYEWILIKHETNYMTEDFPKEFPFSKDIDIIVSEKDYKELTNLVCNYFFDTCKEKYEVRLIEKEKNSLIRVEKIGFLIIQIDIAASIKELKDELLQHSIKHRIKMGDFYLPMLCDEICYRIREVYVYPQKKQHIEFLTKHKDDMNLEYIRNNIKIPYEDVEKIIHYFKE